MNRILVSMKPTGWGGAVGGHWVRGTSLRAFSKNQLPQEFYRAELFCHVLLSTPCMCVERDFRGGTLEWETWAMMGLGIQKKKKKEKRKGLLAH